MMLLEAHEFREPGTKKPRQAQHFSIWYNNCMFVCYNTQNLRIKQEMNVVAQWFCSFGFGHQVVTQHSK